MTRIMPVRADQISENQYDPRHLWSILFKKSPDYSSTAEPMIPVRKIALA